MNPSGSAPTEVLALRVLRVVVRVGLAAIVTFLVGLAFVAVPSSGQAAVNIVLGWGDLEIARGRSAVLFALAVTLLIGLLSWLGRRLAWRALAMGYAAVAPILIYLAVDDATLRRPQTLEEFSPSFPGAEASYNVLMRYGNQRPAGRDFREFKLAWAGHGADKPEAWQKFITVHRAEIEADWSALAPARAWWAELNAFDRIGDLTPARPDAELPAFRPFRALSQRTCAIASLQALDGRGDDAIDTILPLLQVARKLQPSSRTLVRQMMAVVIERLAIETAGFVLDRATVSPAARFRLAAALAAPDGGEAGARRMIAIEYVLAVGAYLHRPLGDCVDSVAKLPAFFRQALNAVSPFVYNPRATLNLYADLTTDEEEIVGRRQLEKLNPRQARFFQQEARPRFKNFMGAMFVHQLIPAYNKVAAAYWKVQDARAALLARVAPP